MSMKKLSWISLLLLIFGFILSPIYSQPIPAIDDGRSSTVPISCPIKNHLKHDLTSSTSKLIQCSHHHSPSLSTDPVATSSSSFNLPSLNVFRLSDKLSSLALQHRKSLSSSASGLIPLLTKKRAYLQSSTFNAISSSLPVGRGLSSLSHHEKDKDAIPHHHLKKSYLHHQQQQRSSPALSHKMGSPSRNTINSFRNKNRTSQFLKNTLKSSFSPDPHRSSTSTTTTSSSSSTLPSSSRATFRRKPRASPLTFASQSLLDGHQSNKEESLEMLSIPSSTSSRHEHKPYDQPSKFSFRRNRGNPHPITIPKQHLKWPPRNPLDVRESAFNEPDVHPNSSDIIADNRDSFTKSKNGRFPSQSSPFLSSRVIIDKVGEDELPVNSVDQEIMTQIQRHLANFNPLKRPFRFFGNFEGRLPIPKSISLTKVLSSSLPHLSISDPSLSASPEKKESTSSPHEYEYVKADIYSQSQHTSPLKRGARRVVFAYDPVSWTIKAVYYSKDHYLTFRDITNLVFKSNIPK